ncbi:hypothetical protein GLP30_11825 [Photobacterium phosphoreum]|uniref:DUF3137 domain-containing protein n=1 Tax=Photobacterium phosphoreum TaxID=659 RepID=A0AAW4ZYE3_PHOPO|nr:hypothetical protein [Photobacterium phosphoreum]MCD9491390.1 hypothetical protein [Photobacterium phosphoreum]MCF2190774.1 hypothetical protein [Photobacterium phosphoreum]MCF2302299.1 hypothetical protein [Photobacterium phosphoreum]
MIIIIFFIVVFVSFALLGFFTSSKSWSWIDAIYYPLGAIGVCLVFFQSEEDRKILDLYEQTANQRAEIKRVESSRPKFSDFRNEDNLIEIQGNHLAHVSKYSSACGDVINDDLCLAAKRISPITVKYEDKFFELSGSERVYSICSSAFPMLKELAESNVLGSTLGLTLPKYFSDGVGKGFYQFNYDGAGEYIDSFMDTARKEFHDVVRDGYFTKSDIDILTKDFEAGLYFSKSILSSLNVCLRAPESIRNGEYTNWFKQHQAEVDALAKLQERVEDIDNGIKSDNVTKFQFLYWPFIIVFALAIKFGKAVSGLEFRNKQKP